MTTLEHRERHRTERIGWLHATVLGANDGIVSTASLVLGVAAAQATHSSVLVAGVAGLVTGAMSKGYASSCGLSIAAWQKTLQFVIAVSGFVVMEPTQESFFW